jgi:geranylgeranyl reductase
MEKYDVIIVGAGPAGLICAEKLSSSDMRILLLEKDEIFGDKVCAGGLTRKDLGILNIPEEILAQKVYKTAVHSPKRNSFAETKDTVVVTINRKVLGSWQRGQLKNTKVEVRNKSRVQEIHADHVVLGTGEKLGYRFLVGADGYASLVRRYLKIPLKKKLIGIQYIVPVKDLDPKLEIFLDSRHFDAWYGWIFPHKDEISVGCCCDPRYYSSKKLKEKFHQWLTKKGIDISHAEYQSAPISYDYRGLKFGNVFLAGEAAGMASGLTGEGIYQSLVSGIEVAGYIMGQEEVSDEMKYVIRYNKIQEKMIRFFRLMGPLRTVVHELVIIMLNNKRFKEKVNKGFS